MPREMADAELRTCSFFSLAIESIVAWPWASESESAD
jgi:hypothetical protein